MTTTSTASTLEGLRAALVAEADTAHLQYPQYREHWDGWRVAEVTRRFRTKLGVAFEPGDLVLVSPETYDEKVAPRSRTPLPYAVADEDVRHRVQPPEQGRHRRTRRRHPRGADRRGAGPVTLLFVDVIRRFLFYGGCHCTILAAADAGRLPATCPTHGTAPIAAAEWALSRVDAALGLAPCTTCSTHGKGAVR
jgi:hypothetical protein